MSRSPRPAIATSATSPAKSLFSPHYLNSRLRDHDEWREDISAPLHELRALYDKTKAILPTSNEAQTEEEFVRPALRVLRFAFIPQTLARVGGRAQRPDYTLFADENSKNAAYPLQANEPAFYSRAVAVADAKYWERPLSETSKHDPRDTYKNTNPSFQMVSYLTGTGVNWGILTNGATWRLYSRLAASTATEFYEVRLVETLASGDPDSADVSIVEA